MLSEAERTAALYSLLQSSTQVQIRFFITVLQQMARSDPMTALLSPGASGNSPFPSSSYRRPSLLTSGGVQHRRWNNRWKPSSPNCRPNPPRRP